jgi:hypothetical protein
MKVKILKPTRRLMRHHIGDVVEVDAALGNSLATIGTVLVIEHDKPDTPTVADPKRRDVRPKHVKNAEALGEEPIPGTGNVKTGGVAGHEGKSERKPTENDE